MMSLMMVYLEDGGEWRSCDWFEVRFVLLCIILMLMLLFLLIFENLFVDSKNCLLHIPLPGI